MKQAKTQLKAIARELTALSKKVDKLSAMFDKAPKAAPKKAKKAAPKKAAKKTTKKAAAKKAAPKKAAPKKAAKASAAKGMTVLDSVFDAIKKSRKGINIAKLKEKTKLDARQLSNALYKLSKKGTIKAVSRGQYAKK